MLLAAVVHRSVLGDHFKHDDFIHLYQIANHGLAEFLLIPHGGHLLSTSNFVFYLCYQVFGIDAAGYQAVSLATHLLNVWLLHNTVERLTKRRGIALLGSALWGMAPVAGGSIGWFSVYGHLLATTFILWVLRDMASRRDGSEPIPGGILLCWYVLLLAAGTSFGVGLGVAATFGAVGWALLPDASNRNRVAVTLGSLLGVLPLLFVLQHEVYDALWGPLIADGRSAIQHLTRVTDLIGMWWRLLCFASAAVFLGLAIRKEHGHLPVDPFEGLEQELSWLTDGVGLVLLVLIGWVLLRSDQRQRWLIAGLSLIALSAYGVIAAGRLGLMERAPSILWMVGSPRYHYLGTLGVTLTACAALGVALTRFSGFERWTEKWGGVTIALWILAALPLNLYTADLVTTREGLAARAVHQNLMASIREAVKEKPVGAPVFIDNDPFKPVPMVVRKQFPGNAAVFVLSFPENMVDGRKVYFVEAKPSVHAAANRRPESRIARLLITNPEKREIRRVWRLKRDAN
ncbi:hypothetical protein MK489_03160 [Myxococcota bacterium]|nr:hypothetical protein [Myxococcota bacterium]